MGIIDSFRKMKEKGKEGEHSTPPRRGFTLAEILQDKSNSHLFGRILERDGQQDLALRLKEGKVEGDDIGLLEEERLKFVEKIEESERIKKLLTEENVIAIARNHPDFATIINLLGPKKAIKAIQGQLKEICITDEDRFKAISEPIEEYDSYKNGEYKKVGEDAEKKCTAMGVSQQEYLDALTIGDPAEKEKALWKLAKGKHTKFRTALNYLTGKTTENFKGLQDSGVLLERSIVELDKYKEDIGNTLFLSISGNDDMLNALSRELVSENAPAAESKTGFADIKKETFNEKEFDEEWEAEKIDKDYDSLGEPEQELIKSSFVERARSHYEKKNKGKGFWASVLSAFIEKKISNKIETLH